VFSHRARAACIAVTGQEWLCLKLAVKAPGWNTDPSKFTAGETFPRTPLESVLNSCRSLPGCLQSLLAVRLFATGVGERTPDPAALGSQSRRPQPLRQAAGGKPADPQGLELPAELCCSQASSLLPNQRSTSPCGMGSIRSTAASRGASGARGRRCCRSHRRNTERDGAEDP